MWYVGVSCAASHVALTVWFYRYAPRGPWTYRAANAAHALLVLAVSTYLAVVGTFGYALGPTPVDTIHTLDPTGRHVGEVALWTLLLYDLPVHVLVSHRRRPDRILSRVVLGAALALLLHHDLMTHYLLVYAGVVEWATIPLAVARLTAWTDEDADSEGEDDEESNVLHRRVACLHYAAVAAHVPLAVILRGVLLPIVAIAQMPSALVHFDTDHTVIVPAIQLGAIASVRHWQWLVNHMRLPPPAVLPSHPAQELL